MIKKHLLFLVILSLLVNAGCSEKKQYSESAKIAKNYLEEKGYIVTSIVSDINEALTKKHLDSIWGQQEWNVQQVKPDQYVGKSIDRVMFTVKNHPLNEKYDGEIRVTVFLFQNEIIGGTSFALEYDGALYYLDGGLN